MNHDSRMTGSSSRRGPDGVSCPTFTDSSGVRILVNEAAFEGGYAGDAGDEQQNY